MSSFWEGQGGLVDDWTKKMEALQQKTAEKLQRRVDEVQNAWGLLGTHSIALPGHVSSAAGSAAAAAAARSGGAGAVLLYPSFILLFGVKVALLDCFHLQTCTHTCRQADGQACGMHSCIPAYIQTQIQICKHRHTKIENTC